jgi:hypothetical protein
LEPSEHARVHAPLQHGEWGTIRETYKVLGDPDTVCASFCRIVESSKG